MWQNCFKSTVIYLFFLYTEFDEILHNLFSFLMEFGIASPVHPILWIQQLYEAAPVLLPDFFFFFFVWSEVFVSLQDGIFLQDSQEETSSWLWLQSPRHGVTSVPPPDLHPSTKGGIPKSSSCHPFVPVKWYYIPLILWLTV